MELSKQEFLLKDLPTKYVTLYPTRAQVIRGINDITLQPGQNEIEIYGLTPTVDEQSIQVFGTGAAIITDFTVELVPNRDIFDEVYPEDDKEDGTDSSSDEDEPEIDDCDQVKALEGDLESLHATVAKAKETINSAARQLDTLDVFTKSLRADKNTAENVVQTIGMYESERAKIFSVHCEATETLKKTEKLIEKKKKEKESAGRGDRKTLAEKIKAREKRQRQQALQKQKRRQEARRVREEHLKFWPKKVFVVTVNLETPLDTPASSRRGSIDSVTLAQSYRQELDKKGNPALPSDGKTVSLSLSYVTRDASWTPRYDISLSSTNKTASIAYRAELVNGTSEVWSDTQVILSTSQTTYSGLEDKIPRMHPWHVKLDKWSEQGLLSPEEMNHPRGGTAQVANIPHRNELFGSSDAFFTWGSKHQQAKQQQMQNNVGGYGQFFSSNNANVALSGTVMASKAKKFSAFGSSGPSGPPAPAPASSRIRRLAARAEEDSLEALAVEDGAHYQAEARSTNMLSMPGLDDNAVEGLAQQIDYQESSWDDHGLTSTYEVPGTRSLLPSSLARRHKIASLNVPKVQFSHVLVAKLRPSAFFKAKIRNPSSTVTLLKGTAGITLDGSFIGNTILSRVAPGSVFDLPLGVDPSVQVSYPKPTVHRSTGGIFNKEVAQVFSRNIWITNSKTTQIEMLVLDQIPISEDDRLHIGILQPRGLSKVGDAVKAGTAAKESASGAQETSKTTAWGNAIAKLKKDGEVAWTVTLEKKQACLLKLEYETRMPAAEKIVPA